MNRPSPLITILMPCRNAHAGFLSEALESVFAQTTPRWALLVVSDASDDPATLAALAELEGRGDERVRVIVSRSRYVSGAVNTGMEAAQTDFVCTLHCDDLLDHHAVETVGRFVAEQPEVDYFYSSRQIIDEQGRALSGVQEAAVFSSLGVFVSWCPVKPLHCWRVRSALAIGGMDESFGIHGGDDYDFAWSMAEAGSRFQTIPERLYLVRDHREHFRLTTHVPLDVQIGEVERILRKHGVPEPRVREQVERRQNSYLRQALYTSQEDRERKERDGFDPRTGWRQPHRPPLPQGRPL